MINPIIMFEGLNVTFQTTQNCNLRCKYCYEIGKKDGELKLEYAKKFIDDLVDDPDPVGLLGQKEEWILKKGIVLDFIGGDALMTPTLIDQILTYFIFSTVTKRHRWANRWRASISTNGTLFGRPEVRRVLEKYKGNMSVGVSVDGCPEIHDKNRIYANGRGTMADILKWWPWYINYVGIENATTKSTLNSDSIPYIAESVRFLHEELGLAQINMNFIFEEMFPSPDLVELERQMEKTVAYVLDHRHDVYLSLFDRRNAKRDKSDPNTGWCGSGAMPCLSVSGKYYPCFRFAEISMQQDWDDVSVGDVWTGFSRKYNFAKIRGCTREVISPQMCKECDVESSCAWCIAGAFAESGKFYRQTNICSIHKIQAKWSKIYWDEYYKLEGNRN